MPYGKKVKNSKKYPVSKMNIAKSKRLGKKKPMKKGYKKKR